MFLLITYACPLLFNLMIRWSFSRTPTWAVKNLEIKDLRKGLVGWLMCRPCWNCSISRNRTLWRNAVFFNVKYRFLFEWVLPFFGTIHLQIATVYRKILWIHLNQPGLSMPTEIRPSQGHRVATIPLSTPGAVGNNPACQVEGDSVTARIVEILHLRIYPSLKLT